MTIDAKYPTSKNSNQWNGMTRYNLVDDSVDDSSYLYNNDGSNCNDEGNYYWRHSKKWKWNRLLQSIKNYLFGQYECLILILVMLMIL